MKPLFLSLFVFVFGLQNIHAQKYLFEARIGCNEDLECHYILFDSLGQQFIPDTINGCKIWKNLLIVYSGKKSTIWHLDKHTKLVENVEELIHTPNKLMGIKVNGKWGYLNSNGELIIPYLFEEASNFHQNIALVFFEGQKKYIDTNGKYLVEIPKSTLNYFNLHGTQEFTNPKVQPGFKHPNLEVFPEEPYYTLKGLRNTTTGDTLFHPTYTYIGECENNSAIVLYESGYGVLNFQIMKHIIPCIYDRIYLIK